MRAETSHTRRGSKGRKQGARSRFAGVQIKEKPLDEPEWRQLIYALDAVQNRLEQRLLQLSQMMHMALLRATAKSMRWPGSS